MEIKESIIYLDKDDYIYKPGETISGRIEYLFPNVIKVRDITVLFRGYAHVEFVAPDLIQRYGVKKKPIIENKLHTSDEEYFNVSFSILTNQQGEDIQIPSGKQVYPFKYTLPETIPSSFEGKHGYVRYNLKITLDKSTENNVGRIDQFVSTSPFEVTRNVNRNIDHCCTGPLHIQMKHRFKCLCCVSRPLKVDVRAPETGYWPGRNINLEVDVDNRSNVSVKLIEVSLRRLVAYKAVNPKNFLMSSAETIKTVPTGSAPSGSKRHWSIQIEVPTVPPSKMINCDLISLDYDIHVKCNMRCRSNQQEMQPIYIGTGPIVCRCNRPKSEPLRSETPSVEDSAKSRSA